MEGLICLACREIHENNMQEKDEVFNNLYTIFKHGPNHPIIFDKDEILSM